MSEQTFKSPPASPSKRMLALIVGALVPGAGHFILGRHGRALLFAVCIYGMASLGLLMHGHFFLPSEKDRLAGLYFLADLGLGLLYPVSYLLNIGFDFKPMLATFEYGTNYLATAGLLNYLIVLDAMDIGAGKKP